MKQPQLITNRLLLCELEDTDWRTVSFLRTDKKVNKYVNRPSAETEQEALNFIAKINDGVASGNLNYWKIALIENPQMIGSICLWNFSEDRKTAEIGYDLSPEFQGKGLMTESLSKIIEYGFKELKLETIEAFTHKDNLASTKLLENHKFILQPDRMDEDDQSNVIFVLTQ